MRDAYVKELYYSMNSENGVSYSNPESLSFTNHIGEFRLSKGELIVVPVMQFSTPEDARLIVDPYLKSWEIHADLTRHFGMIRFDFVRANVIEQSPPSEGADVKEATFVSTAIAKSFMASEIVCKKYPVPPTGFFASALVQSAYRRWIQYLEGKEPLQAMTYFVLTLIETMGGRDQAAELLSVDVQILKNIGRLSSTRGDEVTARKASSTGEFQPLSNSEECWLQAAIRQVIYRLGEYDARAALKRISMNDLPPLP